MEYNKGEIVLVQGVDPHGFLGRENHPEEYDIGLTGEVVRSVRVDGRVCQDDDPETWFEMVTILTFEETPRFLDMMDFEISRRSFEPELLTRVSALPRGRSGQVWMV